MGVAPDTESHGAEPAGAGLLHGRPANWADAHEILSLVPDAVVSADEKGRIVLFNRAAEEMFGYAWADVDGQPVEMLIPHRFSDSHARSVLQFAVGDTAAGRRMGERREVVGRRKDGGEFVVEASVSRQSIGGQALLTAVIRDGTERKRSDDAQRLVAAEMSHRFKNTIAVVSSIVRLTAATSTSVPAFADALLGRLGTLARTHDVLMRDATGTVDVRALIEAELSPYRSSGSGNVALTGPAVQLSASAAVNFGLALHELATNAAKYGALSKPAGRVAVDWEVAPGGERLNLVWREAGGPPVSPPARRGFGSQLIERCSLRPARVEFEPEGLCARLAFPLGRAQASGGEAVPAGDTSGAAV